MIGRRERLSPLMRKIAWRIGEAEQRYAAAAREARHARAALDGAREQVTRLETRLRELMASGTLDRARYEQVMQRWLLETRRQAGCVQDLERAERELRAVGEELLQLKHRERVLQRRLDRNRRIEVLEAARREFAVLDDLWLAGRQARHGV